VRTPTALTIAGSDSGGGAGIQADLKAFARCGVHGTSAVTAITAQNTVAVIAILPIDPAIVLAQVRAVIEDIPPDAVKIGMLGTADVVLAVASALELLTSGTPVVLDPVMVAESGAPLLDEAARGALIDHILPRATVLTPNLPEARTLIGGSAIATEEEGEAEALARALLALGPQAVVITGGHRERASDLFLARGGEDAPVSIDGERHPDGAAHGSGCTHSSVLAAQLALGRTPLQAARIARSLTGVAVAAGLRDVGSGAGPVDVLGLAHLRES
jgi:hydroxymethylpyrimidine/phosphomethylpyrimidine kinase